MTSREKVLNVYKDAHVWPVTAFPMTWDVQPDEGYTAEPIGTGRTEESAWDDAASKLPPGSPAGETASEEHGGCNCAPIKGQHSVYCPLWVPEKGAAHPSFTGPAETGADLGICMLSSWSHRKRATCRYWHPWPPKTIVPSAPEAAAASDGPCRECAYPCEVWFAPNELWNQVVPDRTGLLCLRCFVRLAAAKGITKDAWKLAPEFTAGPEAAAALAAELGVEYVVTYEHRLAARKRFPGIEPDSLAEDIGARLEAVLEQSAAPIAPAAEVLAKRIEDLRVVHQNTVRYWEHECAKLDAEKVAAEELIQALEKALTELVDSIEDAGGHDENGDVFDIRRACAVIARAEEYRKGAKNAGH